jgi:hypothetical protein
MEHKNFQFSAFCGVLIMSIPIALVFAIASLFSSFGPQPDECTMSLSIHDVVITLSDPPTISWKVTWDAYHEGYTHYCGTFVIFTDIGGEPIETDPSTQTFASFVPGTISVKVNIPLNAAAYVIAAFVKCGCGQGIAGDFRGGILWE